MNKNNLPVVAGVEINVDEFGRYNLNALHKASGGDPIHAPAQWTRLQKTKNLIGRYAEKHSGQDVINTVNGGMNPGTFATELLAIDYAAWIDTDFKIYVYEGFQAYKNGTLVQPQIPHDYKSAVQHLLVQIEENERLGIQVQTQQHYMQEAADELEHYDAYREIANAEGAIPLAEAMSSLMGNGRNTDYKTLRDLGVLQKGKTLPYQKFIDSGYFIVRTSTKGNKIISSAHVTPKGMDFLYKKLEDSKFVHRSMDIEMLLRNLRAHLGEE